jgi:DNA polymerase-1
MKTLLLIDANSLIHRAFHALPPFTSPQGEPTGALYGLASILLKIKREQKPDDWAAAFDRPEPTFRKEVFKEYKIQRLPAPPELVSQIIRAQELFQKFGIKFFEQPGLEADDLIASLVKRFKKEKDRTIVIFTGDLDTLQLVRGDKVVVETPKKGVSEIIIYNEAAIGKRYGLNPEQMPDYKALVGDPSDNIPGLSGIGPKTASRLLTQFYDLDNLYQQLKSRPLKDFRQKDQKLFQKVLAGEKQARWAQKLILLKSDADLKTSLEDLSCRETNDFLVEYFKQLGFSSLVSRVSSLNSKPPAALF